jgi:acyl-CoA hydrolase
MTWIVMPSQANALGTVFGGQIMAWVDVCAAVSAQRLARANVVTVGMDELTFQAPIRQGQVVVLQSQVNWAGHTSMEVGVRVESEDPLTGARTHTSTAYLTFVTVSADGGRVPLPALVPESALERQRWADAVARRDARLANRAVRAARGGS